MALGFCFLRFSELSADGPIYCTSKSKSVGDVSIHPARSQYVLSCGDRHEIAHSGLVIGGFFHIDGGRLESYRFSTPIRFACGERSIGLQVSHESHIMAFSHLTKYIHETHYFMVLS